MKIYEETQIDAIVQAFLSHKILAFPTDTVYGVGVLFGSLDDLDRLKHCKHRPETKPIPVMTSGIEQIRKIAVVSKRTEKIIQSFLPGPLTLILPLKEGVDSAFTNGNPTIAVRVPDAPLILSIIEKLQYPLFVTSANQSGAPTSVTFEQAMDQLPLIDGIVKGSCMAKKASTIVDCTKDQLQILRPGPISLEQLESAVSD